MCSTKLVLHTRPKAPCAFHVTCVLPYGLNKEASSSGLHLPGIYISHVREEKKLLEGIEVHTGKGNFFRNYLAYIHLISSVVCERAIAADKVSGE